jgi:inorganic pyrophosphatase
MYTVIKNSTFWENLDELVAECERVVDRPKGTPHPRYPVLIYPLDYGYLADSCSGDGEAIDVWIGSLPEKQVTAIVCTVDADQQDAEIKILLGCTPKEAQQVLVTHNVGAQAGILVERPR